MMETEYKTLEQLKDLTPEKEWHLLAPDKKHTVCGKLIDDTWQLGGTSDFSKQPCKCCIHDKMKE